MAEQATVTIEELRAEAKSAANKGVEQLLMMIQALSHGKTNAKNINEVATNAALHVKKCIGTLAKKYKKQSKSSSENLTKPCAVLPEFAEYVKAMRDKKLLGKIEKGSDVQKAIESIIDGKVSSLLVSTLIISCDNYHQAKQEGVTFQVTPLMEEHLDDVITAVEAERKALHEEDVKAKEENPRGLFNRKSYSSAMNNVIASHIRIKTGEVSKDESLAANLSALQAHLKALNATLRAARE